MYWLVAGSLLAAAVTVYDKWAAVHRPRHRVPERQLWLIAALGGSVAMLVTMRLVRHKTGHRRFMIGLPLLIAAQAALAAAAFTMLK